MNTPGQDPTEKLRAAAAELGARIDHAGAQIADRVDEVAVDAAARLDVIAEELGDARVRFGRRWRSIEEAVTDLGKSAEAPTARVARALKDFSVEARRSYERVTAERPRSRFRFWR